MSTLDPEPLVEIAGVPGWLATPPDEEIEPAIEGHDDLLPLGGLSPRGFEKLIYQLVRRNAEVQECAIYGLPGQAQHGVDLFARRREDHVYDVYQCKRVQAFSNSDLKDALDRFTGGKWYQRADRFVLCTAIDLENTEVVEAFEDAVRDLRADGKAFERWGRTHLTDFLRPHPDVIDLFFGRSWVRRCCGLEAAAELGDRLDALELSALRSRLRALYRRLAKGNDIVLPSPGTDQEHAEVSRRFVLPDVVESNPDRAMPEVSEDREVDDEKRATARSSERDNSLVRASVDAARAVIEAPGYRTGDVQLGGERPEGPASEIRLPFETWSSRSRRLLLLGSPGAGKSALLRFVAQDLLTREPALHELAERWGQRTPILVPFAAVAAKIDQNPQEPIASIVQSWLGGWDSRVVPAVKRAIDNDQFVLLVDGLDESSDQRAAGLALEKLEFFADVCEAPIALTSRPHGIEALAFSAENWLMGTIAPLNGSQQSQLVTRCYQKWHPNDPELASQLATQFVDELAQAPHLDELAANPLLLTLLLLKRGSLAFLPRDRLPAYELLLSYFTDQHAVRRVQAAQLLPTPRKLSTSELRRAAARLAFWLLTNRPEGYATEQDALAVLERYFADEEGLAAREASARAQEVMEMASASVGLMVERFPGSIGFFHRFAQETLSAEWLAGRSVTEQHRVLTEHGLAPAWRDVVLLLLHRLDRPEEVESLLAAVGSGATWEGERLLFSSLRLEVAAGDFRLPAAAASAVVHDAIRSVAQFGWLRHRRRLLGHLFRALDSSRHRTTVMRALEEWYPSRWRPGLLTAMARWSPSPDLTEKLILGLYDDEDRVVRDALAGLAYLAERDSSIADLLAEHSRHAESGKARAAALQAFAYGNPQHPGAEQLAELAQESANPLVQLAGIHLKIRRGEQSDEDLERLLKFASSRVPIESYSLGDLQDLGVQGWTGHPKLRQAAMSGLRGRTLGVEGIESGVAQYWALAAFARDPEVGKWIAEELTNEQFPFLRLDLVAWNLIGKNFRDLPQVSKALIRWMRVAQFHEAEMGLAAPAAPTDEVKRLLIDRLRAASFPHWLSQALLSVWGMDDPDVHDALTDLAVNDDQLASKIALDLPRILEDREAAVARLKGLLRLGRGRPDFVLAALQSTADDADIEEVVTIALESSSTWHPMFRGDANHELLRLAPRDPRVRQLAWRLIFERRAPLAAMACVYEEDVEIHRELLCAATPLHPQLRIDMVAHLRRWAPRIPECLDLLRRTYLDDNVEVLTAGMVAHAEVVEQYAEQGLPSIEYLKSELSATGLDLEMRRQAAFATLITLGRLDTALAGEHDQYRAGLAADRDFTRNDALLDVIGRHWSTLRSALGDRLIGFLARVHNDEYGAWTALATVAAGHPELRQELLAMIQDHSALLSRGAVLRFLAATRPGSDRLREACLTMLANPQPDAAAPGDPYAAGEILATQFADLYTLSDLLARRRAIPIEYDEPLVVTLCLGWPDSKELDRVAEALREGLRFQLMPFLAVAARKATPEELPGRVERIIAFGPSLRYRDLRLGIQLLEMRLSEDEAAASSILHAAQGAASPDARVSFAHLLGRARGRDETVRQWLLTLAGQESAATDLGLNFIAARSTSLRLAVLDSLAP